MGTIFISHSSKDNDAAIKVRDWLKENGWPDVFLDLDPESGLKPGERWQDELRKAGERCSAVLLLISPNWARSKWCQVEFHVAEQLGKLIFPLVIEPTPFDELDTSVKSKFQLADISTPEKEEDGFDRLHIALHQAGLTPNSFPWPPANDPHRSPYRGLKALSDADAAVFFGREAAITHGMDALRQMRDGAPERVLSIQGASGAGKSSFLAAGLIARLKRDRANFIVLPIVRPQTAAISGRRGLAEALWPDATPPSSTPEVQAVLDALKARQNAAMEDLTRLARAGGEEPPTRKPTLILPIDQFEEAFSSNQTQTDAFLTLITEALVRCDDLRVVLTIRSDATGAMQNSDRLATTPIKPLLLSAMPVGGFKEVIEGPGRLAKPPIRFEPELTVRLLEDLANEDALPLLALTLDELVRNHEVTSDPITLADYAEEFGGLEGAISHAVDGALRDARKDPRIMAVGDRVEVLARSAFIPWLVEVPDEQSEPQRRQARLSALPASVRPLIEHFVDHRLLVSETADNGEVIVELAHEAILRRWDLLKRWIDEEIGALRLLAGVRLAAKEWEANSGGEGRNDWLVHSGERLREAEALLGRDNYADSLSEAHRAYLKACRALQRAQETEREDNLDRIEREQKGRERIQNIAWAGIALFIFLLGYSAVWLIDLQRHFSVERSADLARQAQRHIQQAEHSLAMGFSQIGTRDSALSPPAHLAVAMSRSASLNVPGSHTFRYDGNLSSVDFVNEGRWIIANGDEGAQVWDIESGAPVLSPQTEVQNLNAGRLRYLPGFEFCPRYPRVLQDLCRHEWGDTSWFPFEGRYEVHENGSRLLILRSTQAEPPLSEYKSEIAVLDLSSKEVLEIFEVSERVQRVQFGPSESILVDAVDREEIIQLNLSGDRVLARYPHIQIGYIRQNWPVTGGRMLTLTAETSLTMWNLETGEPIHEISLPGIMPIAQFLDHDKVLVTSQVSPGVLGPLGTPPVWATELWDTRTPESVWRHTHTNGYLSGAFVAGGARVLVWGGEAREGALLDAQTGTLREIYDLGDFSAGDFFAPVFNDWYFMTRAMPHEIRIWDTNSGSLLHTVNLENIAAENLENIAADARTVTISESGRNFAVGNRQGDILFIDIDGLISFPRYEDAEFFGNRMLAWMEDGTLDLWDLDEGTRIARRDTGPVLSVSLHRSEDYARVLVTPEQESPLSQLLGMEQELLLSMDDLSLMPNEYPAFDISSRIVTVDGGGHHLVRGPSGLVEVRNIQSGELVSVYAPSVDELHYQAFLIAGGSRLLVNHRLEEGASPQFSLLDVTRMTPSIINEGVGTAGVDARWSEFWVTSNDIDVDWRSAIDGSLVARLRTGGGHGGLDEQGYYVTTHEGFFDVRNTQDEEYLRRFTFDLDKISFADMRRGSLFIVERNSDRDDPGIRIYDIETREEIYSSPPQEPRTVQHVTPDGTIWLAREDQGALSDWARLSMNRDWCDAVSQSSINWQSVVDEQDINNSQSLSPFLDQDVCDWSPPWYDPIIGAIVWLFNLEVEGAAETRH